MNFSRKQKIFFGFLIFLFGVNLIFLDFIFFSRPKETGITSPVSPKEVVITPTTSISQDGGCPPSCLGAIYEATTQATRKEIVPVVKESPQPLVKEFYIPLGSGSTTNRDWEELTGVEAVIDSANFPNVKSIIFEAVLRIPSANGMVYAKLYDLTNKHDVWFSEVSAEGPTSYRAESNQISLSPGRNLYRVKMKSTMGYQALLDSARIKIILK